MARTHEHRRTKPTVDGRRTCTVCEPFQSVCVYYTVSVLGPLNLVYNAAQIAREVAFAITEKSAETSILRLYNYVPVVKVVTIRTVKVL